MDLPTPEAFDTGFRVASIPEPGVGLRLVTGVLFMFAVHRLRRRR